MTQRCPHCGGHGRIQVQAVIEAPAELAHQFSKQNMRRADVFFRGVLWETMSFFCGNSACGRVVDSYGNYVTGLEKRVKELEATLRAVPQIHSSSCKMQIGDGDEACTCHVKRMRFTEQRAKGKT